MKLVATKTRTNNVARYWELIHLRIMVAGLDSAGGEDPYKQAAVFPYIVTKLPQVIYQFFKNIWTTKNSQTVSKWKQLRRISFLFWPIFSAYTPFLITSVSAQPTLRLMHKHDDTRTTTRNWRLSQTDFQKMRRDRTTAGLGQARLFD